ncbi:NAD-binding protein [Phosphitispora fastidiosa]|uniref:NAD-binding protein n=1 Tax=Phosphitispora fastidiosa TaxID=2837202 RepID=UPI001E5261EB|nr:NAD-binding protein [Phosphitispora fastidiosa]MBU7006859.1 hypothetical protein [Phosphitispora fastidiosa]
MKFTAPVRARKRSPAVQLFRDYEWLIIVLLFFFFLALGCIGYAKNYAAQGKPLYAPSILYQSLQLFFSNFNAGNGPIPIELELGRFLAPLLFLYTAGKALAVILHKQFSLIFLRLFYKEHVIICGLGTKGLYLTADFCRNGYRVVVIELDKENDMIDQCREHGAIVLTGNAADSEMLYKAKATKARYVVATCGHDGVNAEIAVNIRQMIQKRRGKTLTCYVHISDVQLCNILKERELMGGKDDSFLLEFFNIYNSGARILANTFFNFNQGCLDIRSNNAGKSSPSGIAIAGFDSLGECLILYAVKSWRKVFNLYGEKLRFTVVDENAQAKINDFILRYPLTEEYCEIQSCEADCEQGDFNIIFIQKSDESAGLKTALSLLNKNRKTQVALCTMNTGGVPELLRGEHSSDSLLSDNDKYQRLHAFGLLDMTCRVEALLSGTHETLAIAMHNLYVEQNKNDAKKKGTLVHWVQLDESHKEQSRREAGFIGELLKEVSCELILLAELKEEQFQFTPEEAEKMAELEHDRWYKHRVNEGWKYGEVRDDARKINNMLLPWADLPYEGKKYNIDMVNKLPELIEEVGFRIYRVKGGSQAQADY